MSVQIASIEQWRQITTSSTIVIADFYADWCGPCKMIAPTFESLANKFSKHNKITFAKVNTDRQQDVAQLYQVSAMPTFVILRNGSVIDTIKGANPPALTAAVEKAVRLVLPGGGASFSGGGQRLGGVGTPGSGSAGPQQLQRPLNWDLNGFINSVIVFFGLYLVSLFSLDPYKAAEGSQFNIKNPPARNNPRPAGPGGAQRPGAPKPAFRTLADVGGD